ncbi:MAG: hypothetical protein AVDCRST_MAG75-1560 [uncultured Propionibacteriaceae bacterium]|uniref:DUF1330 domain-containing protein n=1 Tax=uncultured Propionibacteriaceae bacterium TaxID=257457 RepID=A0A6J4NLL1_9ACTN|nr:MAG: hypothetical protein AVDCRST_MAG75-1560 [uncultured Propionibacteriaceae bacterium]
MRDASGSRPSCGAHAVAGLLRGIHERRERNSRADSANTVPDSSFAASGASSAPVRQNGRMTAYWISVYQEIFDQGKVDAYARLARPALEAAGGTFVARGLPEQTYEAGETTRTVLIVFDSVEAARAAHDSLAYQEALAALDGGARRDMRILPAL